MLITLCYLILINNKRNISYLDVLLDPCSFSVCWSEHCCGDVGCVRLVD
jgi:hypothetical protein